MAVQEDTQNTFSIKVLGHKLQGDSPFYGLSSVDKMVPRYEANRAGAAVVLNVLQLVSLWAGWKEYRLYT